MKQGIIIPISKGTKHRVSFRMQTDLLRITLSVFALLLMAMGSSTAQAQIYREQTLHGFTGASNSDGSHSYASLVALNSKLYGTTYNGGTNSEGTVFAINPDGTGYQSLYSFNPQNGDGNNPYASLIAVSGKLYGTTVSGGTNGDGTIFVINPDGTNYQTLYSFTNANGDGSNSYASLVAVSGKLYGTTVSGGTKSDGTVFVINPDGTGYQTLYSFNPQNGDGINPYASLIAVSGKLYGTTYGGGTNGYGAVFAINLDGTNYQTLHNFMGGSDGIYPYASLIAVNSKLYGTTSEGGSNNGGEVFAINPDGTNYQELYGPSADAGEGYYPYASLIVISGKLYGTTYQGGSGTSTAAYGTIFAINPDGTGFQTVYSFTDSNGDGDHPEASLIAISGKLYGTTSGDTSGGGTVFSLTPITVPVANNDNGRGIANHTITVTAPGVLGNDNLGGDPNTTAAIVTNPTHGNLSFHSDGSFTYTPNTGFVGSDSFTYQDTNLAGTSNTATCSLTIGPVAYPDNGRTYFNTAITINAPGVLGNDATGGLSTTASLVSNPSHGTIAFNTDGSFKYTPTSGYLGTDSFTYKITNSAGTSAPAACTLLVQARTPIANNDAGRVTHNTTATFAAPAVLGNDYLGTNGTVTASLVTNPSHGTITFNSDGSFKYTPTIGFIGTDSFTYKDTNSVGTSNTATCTLTVQ